MRIGHYFGTSGGQQPLRAETAGGNGRSFVPANFHVMMTTLPGTRPGHDVHFCGNGQCGNVDNTSGPCRTEEVRHLVGVGPPSSVSDNQVAATDNLADISF